MKPLRCPAPLRIFLGLILLFTAAAWLPATPLDPAATKALLLQLETQRRANPSLQADFRETKSGGILSRPAVSQGKIWWSAPDKFRREITSGKGGLIVSNGQVLWMFYPAFHEAERYDLKKQGFLNQAIAAFTAGFNLQNLARDYTLAVDQAPAGYTLALTPKKVAISRMMKSLSIHLDSKLTLQSLQIITPGGEMTLTELQNLQSVVLPAAQFEFQPPPGAAISSPLGK